MWLSLLAGVAMLTAHDLDFSAFALHSWTVGSKTGGRVPFDLNIPQQIIDYEIQRLRAAGKPALVKVLKSRRQGVSTYCCARMQHMAQEVRGARAMSLADKAELPKQWLRRAQSWHGEQPESERPTLSASNAIEMYFAGQQSRYYIASAEGKTPGMGDQLEALHLSEIENYLSPGKLFADMFPALALDNPLALALMESTGEMEGSYWHEAVQASIQGQDGWTLVFLPWFISPEYARETKLRAADYTPEEKLLVEQAAQWAKTNIVHAAIADFRGIRPEQIAWRRYTTATLFSGDAEMFACRYPATITEAFMGVGSLAIPASLVRHHRAQAMQPIARFTLEEVGGKITPIPCDPADGLPHWQLFEPLDSSCEYVIGADVAEGRLSDTSDDRSERDYSAMLVLNRRTVTTSALYHGRVEPDRLGREMVKAGRYWHDAWIAPEANSAGMATLAVIRSYSRVMARDGAPDLIVSPDTRPLDKLGWRTTPANRDLLIDEYIRDCRPEPQTDYDGKFRCLCPELVAEEGTFIRTASGKREHRPGRHDDVLFAAMLALQAHRVCPHERAGLVAAVEEDAPSLAERIADGEREGIPDWVITGGRAAPAVVEGDEA